MPVPVDRSSPGRRLVRDEAYERLRELIVAGTLAPGERLRDAEVAVWLGVSRTPVREALAGLVEDGLVESAANRFTRVTEISAADATDGYPVLARLEGLAASQAATAMGDADLTAMRDSVERFTWAVWRGDTEEAAAAESALHRRLADACGNRPLRQLLARLSPRLRRLERLVWPRIAADWPGGPHAGLLTALAEHQPAAAEAAVTAEWQQVGEGVVRALRAAGYR